MRRAAIVAATALMLFVPPARAQPANEGDELAHADRQRAERYFRAGKAAYRSGQYLVAARAFEEAFRWAPMPEIGFTLAQALRRQYFVDGDLRKAERALELYRWYLARVPSGKRRPHAVTHIASLEVVTAGATREPPVDPAPPTTELMVVSAAPGAMASIDGGPERAVPAAFELAPGAHEVRVTATGYQPTTERWLAVEARLVVAQIELKPVPGRLTVRAAGAAVVLVDGRAASDSSTLLTPGEHTVTVTRRGHRPFRRLVALAPGDAVEIVADLQPTRRRTASYYALAAGGVLLASGLATTAVALSADDRASDLQLAARRRNLTADERVALNDSIDRRDDMRASSVALIGSAAVLGSIAAALYFGDEPALAPSVSPRGAGVAYRTAF